VFHKSIHGGIVWIFTYQFPEKPEEFQHIVERIKNEFQKTLAPRLLLTIQTYGAGAFGDCTVRL